MSEMTTEILEQNLSKIVLVRLKGGKSLRGRLKGFDQHLNLVLEETEDTTVVENQKKLGLISSEATTKSLYHPHQGELTGKGHSSEWQTRRSRCPYNV